MKLLPAKSAKPIPMMMRGSNLCIRRGTNGISSSCGMKFAMMPKPKLRRASRRKLSNGLALLSSIHKNSESATTATTVRRTMKGELNQSSLLPSSSNVWRAPRPIAIVAMPAQSPLRSNSRRIGEGSSENHSMPIMIAPGTRLT